MKLLMLSQKVDENDDVLGFVVSWLKKLSQYFEAVQIICLAKGEYHLPQSVSVYSLGKEKKPNRLQYLLNFYRYLFFTKLEYEAVLVHMNPEYIILAAWWWKLKNKKIFLWYNHAHGGHLARLAARLANKVFYTSPYAWAASLPNSQIMPVGVDTDIFNIQTPKLPTNEVLQILSLGRISPVKKIEILIEAASILAKENFPFHLDIYGQAPERDQAYYESIRVQASSLEKAGLVNFYGSVANRQTPSIYNQHQLLVNLTPSGSFDKTIIEALSCGKPVLMCNQSMANILPSSLFFQEGKVQSLVDGIRNIKKSIADKQVALSAVQLREYAINNHSLDLLVKNLYHFIHG